MAWLWLVVAGLLEIVWAFSMKLSDGFTRWLPTTITAIATILSFGLLSIAMKTLPLGTAYVTWTGIGAVGSFIIGVAFLGESLSLARIAAAVLVVTGVVLLRLSA
ncbi:MAG TPA: multidrug efflux SMR transporter [Polyangiaceae bacterium]|nr:multidrug efflux SMR transporter [Polyangiaceae bacterium]